MITFSTQDVEEAIAGVSERLGVSADTTVIQDYQNGKLPRLLSYEKLEKADPEIPTIQRYLDSLQSFS